MSTIYKTQLKDSDNSQNIINLKKVFPEFLSYFLLAKTKTKSSLAYLLPYDSSSKIKKDLEKGLKEYQMLLNMFQIAISEYNRGNLQRFDPIVGENACQIRAVKIVSMFSNNLVDFTYLEKKALEAQKTIEQLLLPKNITTLIQSKMSLKELLNKENLQIFLTDDELYLLKSFILTESKISQPSEVMFYIQKNLFLETKEPNEEKNISPKFEREKAYPKNLKKYGNVSSKFTEKLFRRIRKLLSKESILYLKDITNKHQDESLKEMISDKFETRHLNCYCMPMFWSYKTLFLALQKENIPIIVHAKFIDNKTQDFQVVDEEFLLYENFNDLENHSYSSKLANISDFNRPAVVIQGIVYQNFDNDFKSEWKEFMKSCSIKHVILAGAADHRQYPDPKLDHMISDLKDEEYENYKVMASKRGFSLENPSTFFIQHVYAF
ncbi:MAG: hypothetical protein KR126chlam6_01245 [Candidatus Anoxychlamydiales bacterium]|nr:hypothetical protein [Candidatus Anoxychlamydiales bacterium]